ncbi:membrane protein [Streptococcus varani]|uniref:Membrane protein n=1 Tax=Streptococcus varani TaxID=1608583 RepID=A0A0E4H4W6_9STRE|nr:ABC transporter permease [Streptococcus varani]CQR25322.1 membrane protein [Streptococcus varani]
MKQILLVTKETYLRQVKSWAFLFMVLSPFLFVGFSGGIGYLSGAAASSNHDLAIVSKEPSVPAAFSGVANVTFDYKDETAAKEAYEEKKIADYLLVEVVEHQVVGTYVGDSNPSPIYRSQLEQALGNVQSQLNVTEAHLTTEQQESLARQPLFKEELESESDNMLMKIGKTIAPMAISFVLYFMIIMYSSTTAQEIATEKGTKIMEVIFSSLPARNYFYGRILGIFGAILTHISVYLVGGFGAYQFFYRFPATAQMTKDVTPTIQAVFGNLNGIVVFYVLFGILLFVVISALCGSLVSRPEDAPKAAQPAVFLVMFGFVGSMVLEQSGRDNLLMQIGSYIPVTSPFFMPLRYINGSVNLLESLVSLLMLIATNIALIYFIGKSYAGLILQKDDLGFMQNLKKGLLRK